MWAYNYTNSDELMHFGKKGMHWGVRKGRRQLSKNTGRDKKSISNQEALDYRKDVKGLNSGKQGRGLKFETSINSNGQRDIQWRNSKNQKIGKEYADAVIKQSGKDEVNKLKAGTAVVAGLAAASAILYAKGYYN